MTQVETRLRILDEEELKCKSKEVRFTTVQKKEYEKLRQQAAATTAGLKATLMAWEIQQRSLQKKFETVSTKPSAKNAAIFLAIGGLAV